MENGANTVPRGINRRGETLNSFEERREEVVSTREGQGRELGGGRGEATDPIAFDTLVPGCGGERDPGQGEVVVVGRANWKSLA